MAEANPSKGDSGRTAPEQRDAADKVAAQDQKDREEYDANRAEEVKVDSDDLGNGFVNVGGVIRAGQSDRAITHFPGAEARGLHEGDGVEAKLVKGYVDSLDDPSAPQVGWTAQSAGGYVGDASDFSQIPGQTYSVEELPDAKVLAASGIGYSIPANLVVDGNVTDNISSAQERAGTQKVERSDSSRDKRTAKA